MKRKTTKSGAQKAAPARMTLNRETLRRLEESELQRAAGQMKRTQTCAPCGGTGVTCSGWPPCTC
jgi:hypothetical protein